MNDQLPRERVLMSWSGGKDSALALEKLRASGDYEVTALLTTVSEAYDRISMHGVRTELLHRQAFALGLPLQIVRIPAAATNDAYEERMAEMLAGVRAAGVHVVAFGDLFLEDVRRYREERLASVGMSAVFPLWGMDTAALAERFISTGYRAVLTCVDGDQLDASFCGRAFDPALLADLPAGVDPCGERGEFHSFVYDGPAFSEPVRWHPGETVVREERFVYADLLPA